MPLRKQGTILPSTALVLVIGAAALPATANAWSFSSFWKPRTTTTTQPATTAAPEPTPTTTTAVDNTPEAVAEVTQEAVAEAVTEAAAVPAPTAAPATPGCTPVNTTKAFAKYGDSAEYYPAPGGTFESGGWTLTSGARIVSGNENLGIAPGSKSLQLGVGATATSPAFCVDETQPTFRFTSKLSSLDGGYVAIVLYRDSAGKLTKAQFTSSSDGTYWNGATGWNPSSINPLATKIPLVNGGKTASVQLMFVGTMKAYGMFVGARAYIDSVMVDPYRRG